MVCVFKAQSYESLITFKIYDNAIKEMSTSNLDVQN